jgi:hypothetical protein
MPAIGQAIVSSAAATLTYLANSRHRAVLSSILAQRARTVALPFKRRECLGALIAERCQQTYGDDGQPCRRRSVQGQKRKVQKGQVECKMDKRCGKGTVAPFSCCAEMAIPLPTSAGWRSTLAYSGQMFVASSLASARIWFLARTL